MDTELENRLDKAYRDFTPLARRYFYTFRRPSVTAGGVSSALFLGNHSSGKSSLVNWILGGEAVQDTGVAPTDDGFTVVLFGEVEEDVFGPAALARLPSEFQVLGDFGPAFLQHLRVKVRNREILRSVCLVDSPGMIDSAEGSATRDYDFAGAVRRFAGLCDLVFFLFDPEKPGTTGETVDVFSKCLRGAEFKLRVLLNKCDTFTGMYDFARAYGTLCWNLARVLRTKDLPKIFTTYSGPARTPTAGDLGFADFDRHRAEFLATLRDAASRRVDNVFAAAHGDFAGLSLRMCVVNHAARRLFALKARVLGLGLLVVGLAGFGALLAVGKATGAELCAFSMASALSWLCGALVAGMAGFCVWAGF